MVDYPVGDELAGYSTVMMDGWMDGWFFAKRKGAKGKEKKSKR